MKIVHCITSLDKDGAQQMLYRLVQSLDRQLFQHVIISLREHMPFADDFERLGVKVYSLGMRPNAPNPFLLWNLRKIVLSEAPDLLQGWLYHANCALICARTAPLVWSIRGSLDRKWMRKSKTAMIIRLSGWLSRFADVITYNSKVSIEHHREIGYRCADQRYIANGFQLDRFAPDAEARKRVNERFHLPKDAPLIGTAGRYNEAKDYPGFLRALRKVVDQHPQVVALMMGRGVESSNRELVAIVDKLNLHDHVFLAGAQPDLSVILPALDVFCSSSITEGFPNVVAEALACAVPCVVTDVGMSRELVGNNGAVVDPKNYGALADEIVRVITLPLEKRREMGNNAREAIKKEYDLKVIVKQFQDMYNEVVTRHGK